MKSLRITLLAAAAVCVVSATPSFADGKSQGGGNDCQGNSCGGRAAPGPIAGAGLPILLVAGGYLMLRRYRKRNADRKLASG